LTASRRAADAIDFGRIRSDDWPDGNTKQTSRSRGADASEFCDDDAQKSRTDLRQRPPAVGPALPRDHIQRTKANEAK
jgi:hypothetical protein